MSSTRSRGFRIAAALLALMAAVVTGWLPRPPGAKDITIGLLDPLYRRLGLEPSYALVSDFAAWKRAFVQANAEADVIYLPTNGAVNGWDKDAAIAWVRLASAALSGFARGTQDRTQTALGTTITGSVSNGVREGVGDVFDLYAQRTLKEIGENGYFVRVPAGKEF